MKKLILIVLFIFELSFITVYAASIPRKVTADQHIKVVQYDPNNVVILKGRYGYQTQIIFAPNEVVQNVSIGDSLAWQAAPVSNNLFIKPVAESTTNMTVLTNTNSYNFQLDSLDTRISPTYKLQFTYLDTRYSQIENSFAVKTFNPEQLNWKYSFTGDKTIAPIEAFDNGQFTYFKFKNDELSHLPSVFIVDKNRDETLVNYHMQGKYLVVNAIAKQFTLRDGSHVTSIYNDSAVNDSKK